MWINANRSTNKLLCTKCVRSTALHYDMVPLQKEPIKWEGSLEDLMKQPFYDKQRILFECENCGKLETKTFAVLK